MTEITKAAHQTHHEGGDTSQGQLKQFLTFSIAGSEYGVDIMCVREIKGWTETTRMPNSPDYMRGVINLRGVVIPIFDLRTRFGLGITTAEAKHVVIVIALAERTIGVLADAVSDIITVQQSEIKASPTSDASIEKAFISGLISVQEKMVVLLNVENLFGIDQAAQVIEKVL